MWKIPILSKYRCSKFNCSSADSFWQVIDAYNIRVHSTKQYNFQSTQFIIYWHLICIQNLNFKPAMDETSKDINKFPIYFEQLNEMNLMLIFLLYWFVCSSWIEIRFHSVLFWLCSAFTAFTAFTSLLFVSAQNIFWTSLKLSEKRYSRK